VKYPQRNIILTAFFVILTLIATATVITLQQTGATQTQTKTITSYTSTATIDYTATVQPSTIYNDKTTIKPQDGPIYTKLTDTIDLTLTYTFTSTLQINPTITYITNTTLKTEAWQYQLSATPKTTVQQTTIQLTLPTFNKQEIEQTKARIDNETGVSTGFYSNSQPYYVVEITPTFYISAQIGSKSISQVFQPTISVNSTHNAEGDVIKIEDLTQTSTGALTQQETVTNQDIINQQYASLVLIAVSLVGLGYSGTTLLKQRETTPKTTSTQKMLEPYKHLIIEATENTDNTINTIKVASIAELAKAAETLNKPIFHIKNPSEETLCIIEGTTKYQHTISVTQKSEK
jgi:hypothetical protein